MFLALREKHGRKEGKTTAVTRKHAKTQRSFLKQKAENNYGSNWSSTQVFNLLITSLWREHQRTRLHTTSLKTESAKA